MTVAPFIDLCGFPAPGEAVHPTVRAAEHLKAAGWTPPEDKQDSQLTSSSGDTMTHLNLGELVDALEVSPRDIACKIDVRGTLRDYDSLDSYRGYYSDLAIEPGATEVTVEELLRNLDGAMYGTFHGYKGGEYTMTEMTPVWVSAYGECWNLLVSGVEFRDECVVITTMEEP